MRRVSAITLLLILALTIAGCGGDGGCNGAGKYHITGAYLQYRTYPNADFNTLRGWIEVKQDAELIDSSMVTSVKLYSPTSTLIDAPTSFQKATVLEANWDQPAESFGDTYITSWSGYSLNLSAYADLPAGDYTLEIAFTNGNVLQETVTFPGKAVAPLVDMATFELTDVGDDSVMSWTEPGEVDVYHVVLKDASNVDFFRARVNGVAHGERLSIHFTRALKDEIEAFAEPVSLQVVTRMNADGNNYARGFSVPVGL